MSFPYDEADFLLVLSVATEKNPISLVNEVDGVFSPYKDTLPPKREEAQSQVKQGQGSHLNRIQCGKRQRQVL